jgi:sigma-B regulation protein RsbU (phosphoserine phosphatase)
MKMSKLFQRTLIIMVVLFGIIATVTSILSGWTLSRRLTEEYESKGTAIAKSIADSSVELLLNRDASTVQTIIDQFLEIQGVSYVFVTDEQGDIISHTFVPAIPREVLDIKGEKQRTVVRDIRIEGMGDVINVSAPILVGVVGYVHLGMDKKIIRASIWSAIIGQQSLMFVIFLVSVLVARLLVRHVSQPLSKLSEYVKQLAAHDFSLPATVQSNLALLPGESRDEIGELAASFIHMEQALKHSIEHLKEATAAKERIESELKIAHDIQMSILPKIFPPFPDRSEFDLYATIESAREVGGDFYDFSLVDEHHLWFAIGDVSGKGVPASLFMSATKTLLRAIAGKGNRPDAILAELNEELCRDNDSGMFVTIFHGILHIPSGKLEYSNGGHNLPYVLSRNGTVEPLENTGGMALGVLKDIRYRAKTIQLQAGEGLFLYTDGVTEAMDSADNLFSDRRLCEFLQRANGSSPVELIRGVLGELERFSSGAEQSDDITTLAIHYLSDNNHGSTTMNEQMSILFKNKLSEIERLGQVVEEFAALHHLPPNLIFEINVALEEVLTNVISYGYEDSDEHDIMMRLSCEEGEVMAEIEDDGRPFNPLEAAEPDTNKPLEERPVGGLGIHLVRKLMDDVEYKRQQGKNLLMMKKRIPAA